MKFKQMLKWNWQNGWPALAILSGVLLLVNLLLLFVMIALGESGMNNSNEVSASVMGLVMGIVMYSSALRWGGSNGASRRTIFFSMLVFFVTYSIALAAAGEILRLIFSLAGNSQESSIFYLFYKDFSVTSSGGAFLAMKFLWSLCLNFCLLAVGYLIGAIFYRLGRYGKVIFTVGLPVSLFGLLPVGITLLPKEAMQAIGNWMASAFSFIMQTPLHSSLVFLVVSLLLLAIGWLLVRRAPVKAMSAS